MLRAVWFLILAAIALAVAWGIGSLPGTLTANSGAYTVETSVPAAIVLLVVIVLLLTLLLWLLGHVRRAPGGFGDWRSGRRQKQGQMATERGIVALAAGDAVAAQTEAQTARKLLGDTALVLLLTAESARLAGNTEQAKTAFERLTRHKSLAFLGHRGLLRHHLGGGDHAAALTHAMAAEDAYPGSAWTKQQRLDIALKQQDFRAALAYSRKPAEIAALATAASLQANTPAEALSLAKQAVKAKPAFAPAIAAYANALFRAKRDRAARKALGQGWAASPHPMIAAAWLDRISAPIEQAQAAAELARNAPGHPESELLLAQTALAAQLTGEAKRHAIAAIQAGATDKRVYSVLANLDHSERANAAVANAPAPRWRCEACSAEATDWTALCPQCGRPGTLVWTASGNTLPAPVALRITG